jgi:hypothetical protein
MAPEYNQRGSRTSWMRTARLRLFVNEAQRCLDCAMRVEVLVAGLGESQHPLGLARQREQPLAEPDGTVQSRSPCSTKSGAVTLPIRASERNWSFISVRTGTIGRWDAATSAVNV